MPKAFKRIPASLVEAYLRGNLDQLPQELEEALMQAVSACREDATLDGEAPIEVFIVDDCEEDEEDEE